MQPAGIRHSLESTSVRGGSKTLVAAWAALLLAMGLIACGGGDSSDSTSAGADGQRQTGNAAGETAVKAGDGSESSPAKGKGEGASGDCNEEAALVAKP